jgi:serine/threonine protein kinase
MTIEGGMESQGDNIAVGELFAKRYRIERPLGSGGMGEVYLVTDMFLGEEEKVALKLLHPNLSADERQAKRFLREVQLTRKVTHPNVIRTFDAGELNGRLYFTMEYVEGVSLKDHLKGQPMPPREVCAYLIDICKGLTAIHQSGP